MVKTFGCVDSRLRFSRGQSWRLKRPAGAIRRFVLGQCDVDVAEAGASWNSVFDAANRISRTPESRPPAITACQTSPFPSAAAPSHPSNPTSSAPCGSPRLASNMGSLIQGVGAAWLMTSISQSADLVALVQASTALADHAVLAGLRRACRQFRPPLGHAGGAMFHARRLGRADARRLCRHHDAVAAALLHLPDRLRHGTQQPVMAGGGRRHGAAQRCAGGGGAELDELQPDAQRRPGDRRRDRRRIGRRGRLRGQCGQLHRADHRAVPLEARRRRLRPCRASRWGSPSRPGFATSPCRPTSRRCCCAASSSA